MVALNKHFAPENPHSVEENRVGNFFANKAKSSRVNRLSAQQPRLEKAHAYDETASGMFYYGFRYYDASNGRWLSRDPIGEAGGLNLYGMVGNNPISRWDYLGLADDECPCWETLDYEMDGAPKDRRCKQLEAEIIRLMSSIKLKTGQVAVNNRVLDELESEANAFTQVGLGDLVDAAIGVKLNNSGLAGDVVNSGYSAAKASTGMGDPLGSSASALDSGLKFGSRTYSKVATKVAGKFTGPIGGAITLTELLGPSVAEEWQDFKTSNKLNIANLKNTRGFGSIFSNNSELSNAITKWGDLGCEGRCSKPD